MVAVAQFIPTDPEEKPPCSPCCASIRRCRSSSSVPVQKAEEIFPEVTITLDTVRYDEWEPPVSMTIYAVQPLEAFSIAYDVFVQWLVTRQLIRET